MDFLHFDYTGGGAAGSWIGYSGGDGGEVVVIRQNLL